MESWKGVLLELEVRRDGGGDDVVGGDLGGGFMKLEIVRGGGSNGSYN